MSCILRCSGDQVDIQTLLAQTSLPIHSFWQKGTPRSPSHTDSKAHTTSGLRIVVSHAEFEEFYQQIQDATIFLQTHHEALMRLTTFPGVTDAELDFGVALAPPHWKTYRLPHLLTALAANYNITLCISIYPTEADT